MAYKMGSRRFATHRRWDQIIPPLARSVWPSIQPASGPARKATALAMSSGWPSRSSGAAAGEHVDRAVGDVRAGIGEAAGDAAPEAALPGDSNERAQLCELSSTHRFLGWSGAAGIL
jgi:hypothetical protein